MPEPQRATGTDLKQAILDEARRVLETQGYTSLSTRRLASAVGCTATSIYLYFKSKDALIYALIEEGFEELNQRMISAAEADGTLLERMKRAAMEYVSFGLSRPHYYEIMYTLRAEQMERFPAESYRRARVGLEAFTDMTGAEPRSGLLVGTSLWSSLHGLVSLMIAHRVDVGIDRDALIEHTVHNACSCALTHLASGDAGSPRLDAPAADPVADPAADPAPHPTTRPGPA